MKVAVLFSGGKDSTFAVDWAKKNGFEIAYLLSVKPSRKDCYLFHYATVEHTVAQAKALGLPHVLVGCDAANPTLEAQIVKKIVEKNLVDAVILGGVGLQETQLKSVREALAPLGVQVFASHEGCDHKKIFEEMIEKGYKIKITQVASAGLIQWLGKIVSRENFSQLAVDSKKFGFHIGFEGGYADTFVLDAPVFVHGFESVKEEKIIEDEFCGHVEIKELKPVQKETILAKR
ncbi:MAG: diphthine--ammonia ligase [Candidatus Diapherotrites archaeon]|nr:diphthine--ammonia ligase [Candidatus Diapherotrites archaeon]